MFIINGRLGQDSINPKFTCKDCSTIDYFICSPNMTQYMLVFNVLEFSPLFSDSQCGIELKIDVQYSDNVLKMTENNIKTEKVISWNCDKASSFEKNCDNDRLQSINQALKSMRCKHIQKSDIDSIVNDMENMFESACIKTFGTRKAKSHKYKKPNEPWFSFECRNARNSYHKARKLYNIHKTEYYKTLLKTVSKTYKNTVH